MTNEIKARRIIKKDYYTAIIKAIEANEVDFSTLDKDITNDMVKTFAQNELDLLAKKNAADRKPSAKDKANEDIKSVILAVMDTTPATVSEVMKRDEALSELSNQKVAVLMNQLCADGVLKKFSEKRKTYFTLA